MKNVLRILSVIILAGFINVQAYAHCEVPCGIYTDHLRIELIKEHIMTIEKAMNKIDELSAADEVNYNQLVRWINTKEEHANLIQDIAEQYFMTQRVKPVDSADEEAYTKYITQLSLLHEILIYSMKTKQSTNLEMTGKLFVLVENFETAYFGPEEHDHGHQH